MSSTAISPSADGVSIASDATRCGCRACGAPLARTFVDLGMMPLAQNFLRADQLDDMEPFYPLHAYICEQCLLVQLKEYVSPREIFTEYAYFSSYSDSWLKHAQQYCEQMTARWGLNSESQVVEIASNDGYLLQYFLQAGIPVLGVEPAGNVAAAAVDRGVPTVNAFFNTETARALVADGTRADLLVGNNVLAHVPAVNDLAAGMALLLADQGVITMEFPHLARLMDENQFDTIYHEHFSYFMLSTAQAIFARQGLTIFDVEQLPTHGGSLRIYACHAGDASHPVLPAATELLNWEASQGYDRLETYLSFTKRVERTKRQLLSFLMRAREEGRTVAGYGAPAKANTLLNYCGVRTDLLDYTTDRSPHKHGKFLPGTHIPVYSVDEIAARRPDYVLILPWNLRTEIMHQLASVREWGAKFVVPIPELTIL